MMTTCIRSLYSMLLNSLVVAVLFLGNVAWADESIEEQNKALVQATFDKWKAGKGSFVDMLAPDVNWTITGSSPVAGTYTSREEFIAKAAKPFAAKLSTPITPTILALYADGDTVIVRWLAEATTKDNQPYVNNYAWFLQIKDGKVVKGTAFFDGMVVTDIMNRIQP